MSIEIQKDKEYLLLDIEADGLNPSRIWCLVGHNLKTGEKTLFTPKEVMMETCPSCKGLRNITTLTDNLDAFETPCPVCKGEGEVCVNHHSEWADEVVKYLNKFDYFVGHNILGYDIPVLNRFLGTDIRPEQCLDTLVLSRLFRPTPPFKEVQGKLKRLGYDTRLGGHSVEEWGARLGIPKLSFKEFHKYSETMLTYCIRDVDVNLAIWNTLVHESKGFSPTCIQIEHQTAYLLRQQQLNGFKLDVQRARELQKETQRLSEIGERKLRELFPPIKKVSKQIKIKYRKDGQMSEVSRKTLFNNIHEKVDEDTYNILEMCPFNPKSPAQVAERLLNLGWKPKAFTPSGAPKTDAKTLEEACLSLSKENPSVSYLVNYRKIVDRLNKITSCLQLADKETHRVHGNIIHIGAATHRCSHSKENMANIAAVQTTSMPSSEFERTFGRSPIGIKKFETLDPEYIFLEYSEKAKEVDLVLLGEKGSFGWESRQCWTVEEGNVLIGSDASGIQLRALAHYIDDPEYTEKLIEEDIHVVHQEAAGLPSRSIAKKFIYAWLLGGGDERIGSIAGVSEEELKDLFEWGMKAPAPYPSRTNQRKDFVQYTLDKLRRQGRETDKKAFLLALKGAKLKQQFLEGIPALKEFKLNTVPAAAKKGYIHGLDGRKLWIPNEHLAMSMYLQGFETVAMRVAMLLYHKEANRRNIWFKQVAFVHDEFQIETRKDTAEELGEIVSSSFKKAGEILKTKCPLDGEYLIGRNWAETH